MAMSLWFKDVTEYDGAVSATKNGMFAALGFAAMTAIGLGFVAVAGGLPGQTSTNGAARYAAMAGILIEMAVILFAAWRFRLGKGLIIGIIILALFTFEVVVKLLNGTAGLVWFVAYFAILLGLVNGIRGAWALRSMSGNPESYADTFA